MRCVFPQAESPVLSQRSEKAESHLLSKFSFQAKHAAERAAIEASNRASEEDEKERGDGKKKVNEEKSSPRKHAPLTRTDGRERGDEKVRGRVTVGVSESGVGTHGGNRDGRRHRVDGYPGSGRGESHKGGLEDGESRGGGYKWGEAP